MATAIKRAVPPAPPPPYEVALTLTQTEAELLRTVLDNVGGSHAGPRGVMDGVNNALNAAGVRPARVKYAPASDGIFIENPNG